MCSFIRSYTGCEWTDSTSDSFASVRWQEAGWNLDVVTKIRILYMSEIKPRSTELSRLTQLRITSSLFFQRRSLLVFFSVFIILTLSKSDVDPPASSNGRLRMPLSSPPFLTFSLTVPLSCPIPQEPPMSYVTILLPPTSKNGSE